MQEASELEIYVHIPFCVKKCAYCDFLSFPGTERTKEEYVAALLNEIKYRKNTEVTAKGLDSLFAVTSVFFGGGTPTVLRPELLCEVLRTLREEFIFSEDAEITFECNPATASFEDLMRLRSEGFNRISIGLQSAVDEELKRIGRIHDHAKFLETYENAVKAGFENINVDIITALPEQKKEDVKKTLDSVLSLSPVPGHISAYSLILEPGTEFEKMDEAGLLFLPDEDSEREFHWMVIDTLERAGYRQYELSNLALPGYECRHNIGYWTGKQYLGFGLGASSYFGKARYAVTRSMKEYMDFFGSKNRTGEIPLSECEKLTGSDEMSEFMILGLRMTEGIEVREFFNRFSRDVFDVYKEPLDKHITEGLLECENGRIRFTKRGQDVANYCLADFV